MNYYRCSTNEIHIEIQRRGYNVSGSRDQLSEILANDDNNRGTEATTVATTVGISLPRELNLLRTGELGQTAPAGRLVNERIVYWTMNSLFPTLQLFFESGFSCTIDGGSLHDIVMGLDPSLRFRLTDCTYEEDGRVFKTARPDKFMRPGTGICIKEVVFAQRTSIVVRPREATDQQPLSQVVGTRIGREVHTVIGLRFEGMSTMAFVWAETGASTIGRDRIWGDVRIVGLRKDAPTPILPMQAVDLGSGIAVLSKKSQIRDTRTEMERR